MPDYQLGKIYKIVCNITDEYYIGSTTQPTLARRLAKHRSGFSCWKRGTGNYTTSFVILERGDYDIYLIENYPCSSKDELRTKEGEFHRLHIGNKKFCNKNIEKRSIKEWHEDNKERNILNRHNYYKNNSEHIKNKSKIYHENNKEKIAILKQVYYQNVREKKSTRITCDCGLIFTFQHKLRHEKSKHHIARMKVIESK